MPLRARLEVAAVLATAALHFVFYDLLPGRGVFIAVTAIGWIAYIVLRSRQDPSALREFGLSRDGLRPTAKAAAAIFIAGGVACVAIGRARGPLVLDVHMLWTALLYPAWGLLQQVLVLGIVARHLSRSLPAIVVVAVAAVLFGAVHLPHLALAGATAALGAVFTAVYLRWRNVVPLGVVHGWLGVLFYFWVLGRDPWLEIAGG